MKERFNASQVSKVIDQALVYQCACPAQVCRAIFELRELHEYQINCAGDSVNDEVVHNTIALATEKAHELMEDCLAKILEIEGWDMATLNMPEALKKKAAKDF
jgi:3-deoxy-D-manno-octulosonate 8-phosphate phosphatase KdsC-like HAD superfamily phosphatase